jgi:hypothetical protein
MTGEAKVTLPKAYCISLSCDTATWTSIIFKQMLFRLPVSFCLRWMAKSSNVSASSFAWSSINPIDSCSCTQTVNQISLLLSRKMSLYDVSVWLRKKKKTMWTQPQWIHSNALCHKEKRTIRRQIMSRWKGVLLEKILVVHCSRNFMPYIKPQGSILYSKRPATASYSETDKCIRPWWWGQRWSLKRM